MLYANKKQQIHSFLFIISLLMGIIFSGDYKDTNAQKIDKVETGTGLSSFTGNTTLSGAKRNGRQDIGKTTSGTLSNESNAQCNKECKIKHLENIGIIPEIAESLVQNCKALSENPIRCIKTGAFIVVNESSGGKSCKKSNSFNCFGLSVQEDYKSYNDGVIHFIGKYNRFWLNQTSPNGFYSNSPDWKPATRFCLSETSSGLPYCKNGHRIAWSVFNKLNKLF